MVLHVYLFAKTNYEKKMLFKKDVIIIEKIIHIIIINPIYVRLLGGQSHMKEIRN